MRWIWAIRNSDLHRLFYLWNWTKLRWLLGRGHLSRRNHILFSQWLFHIGCSLDEPFNTEGSLRGWQSQWLSHMCHFAVNISDEEAPQVKSELPRQSLQVSFCKAKLHGSWMRGFCLEAPGTWPCYRLMELNLTSEHHLLSPKQHMTLWVCMQNLGAPQCLRYCKFSLCRPWTVLLPAGVVMELAVFSHPDTIVATLPSPMIKYSGCSEITPLIVPVW